MTTRLYGDVLPDNDAVTILKQFLADADPLVQEEAVDTIAGIEPRVDEAIVEAELVEYLGGSILDHPDDQFIRDQPAGLLH